MKDNRAEIALYRESCDALDAMHVTRALSASNRARKTALAMVADVFGHRTVKCGPWTVTTRYDRSHMWLTTLSHPDGRKYFTWSVPGVFSGSALVFIQVLGMFAVPDILGGTRDMLIGNLIKYQFLGVRDWPFGAALSIIFTLMVLTLAGISAWAARLRGAT